MIGSYLSIGLLLSTLLPLIQSESVVFQSSTPRVFKIAVIGSGPSGASAAYFLSKANDLLANSSSSDSIQVTVFEKEERIGGRTAIAYPYDDHRYDPVELGASIFADVNRNLKRAVKDFGLETGARIGEPESILGIWDGQQFLIEGIDEGWWNSARFLWRYGYSPLTARGLVKKLVSKFLKLYDTSFLHRPSSKSDFEASIYSNSSQTSESAISEGSYTRSGYPWHSIEDLAQALNFTEFAAQDAESMFYNQGVSKLFVEEMIEAATRVNYAQNVDLIHGIGGGVSLAASGATGVKSGNYRIFEEMIGRSGAKLRLGKSGEVTGLIKFSSLEEAFKAGKITQEEFDSRTLTSDPSGVGFGNESEYIEDGNESLSSQKSSAKWWLGTESGFGELYDAVFVGTPWKNSGISLINTDKTIPTPDYVHLHVTLLVTNASHPSPAYFGRGKADDVPTTILTSFSAVRRASQDKENSKLNQVWDLNPFGRRKREEIRKREPKLEFNSLNYLAKLPPLSDDVSSRSNDQSKSLSSEHLVKIFSLAPMSDEKLVEIMGDSIRWTYRKEWDAYPVLSPTREFPPVEPDENLFFINALESLVSTMETSTVASRNSVAIFLERNFGHHFVHGGSDCPNWDKEDSDEENEQSDWASWGCRSG